MEKCEVDWNSSVPWPVREDGIGSQVTAMCAEAVGDQIGLDWESFGEEPKGYDHPTTPAQLVVSGTLLIVAPSNATIASALSDGAPPRLRAQLSKTAAEEALSGGQDAGELYYSYLITAVSRVVFERDPADASVAASYQAGVVTVNNWTSDPYPTEGGFPIHPFRGAAILFHEAGHSESPSEHVACVGHDGATLCDPDRDGAIGAAEWWRFQWFISNGGSLDFAGCGRLMDLFYRGCSYINDDPSYPACHSSLWESC
jgi:hypothetical protein